MSQLDVLQMHCKTLRMPTAFQVVEEVIASAKEHDWSLEEYTRELLEREIEGRRVRRIERLTKASRLPVGKTLATFDTKRLPLRTRRVLPELCQGEFVDRADNVGLPVVLEPKRWIGKPKRRPYVG